MLFDLPLQTILWTLGSISGGLFIVAMVLLVRIRLLPVLTPFDGKPSPVGLALSQVLPEELPGFFRLGDLPYFGDAVTHQVDYRGAGANIQLTAVNAGSRGAALSVVKRTRRGRTRNTYIAARFRGDHPYVFKNSETERMVAWVNGHWAFVARSADHLALEQFMETFPY